MKQKQQSYRSIMLQIPSRQARHAHPHEQESLSYHIAATDREIDQLVYELYGLTDEEIKIVES